jgi:hypothetical protein
MAGDSHRVRHVFSRSGSLRIRSGLGFLEADRYSVSTGFSPLACAQSRSSTIISARLSPRMEMKYSSSAPVRPRCQSSTFTG